MFTHTLELHTDTMDVTPYMGGYFFSTDEFKTYLYNFHGYNWRKRWEETDSEKSEYYDLLGLVFAAH
jgi:hypothetical protein